MRFLLVVALLVVVIARPSDQLPETRETISDNPCLNEVNGRYVNNPASCRAFWSCQEGQAIPVNCPRGYNFNEKAQLCDLEKDFPCTDGVVAPPPTTVTTQQTDSPTDPPTPSTTVPDPDRPVCYGLPDGYFVNNPINCAAYWVCHDEVAHDSSCREGLNFNEELQLCDNPDNFPCLEEITTTTPPPTTAIPPFQCPPTGVHTFPVPDTCTTFRFCFGGALRIRSCAKGLHYDEVNRRCDRIENLNCVRGMCPAENDVDHFVTHPSQESCQQFFICYNGELQPFECAPGLSWNQAMGHCDLAANVECKINPPPKTTTTEKPLDIECLGSDIPEPHIIPHPRDCSRYFICSVGTPHPRSCPQDLLFDPVLQSCNKPNRVKCFNLIN